MKIKEAYQTRVTQYTTVLYEVYNRETCNDRKIRDSKLMYGSRLTN